VILFIDLAYATCVMSVLTSSVFVRLRSMNWIRFQWSWLQRSASSICNSCG